MRKTCAAIVSLLMGVAIVAGFGSPPASAAPKPPPAAQPVKGHPPTQFDGGVHTDNVTQCPAACYLYAGGGQPLADAATGVGADITISTPYIALSSNNTMGQNSAHTLIEISYQDAGGDVLEIGWTVDPSVNGGSVNPYLFTFAWNAGVPLGYNTSGGFVNLGGCSPCAGGSLTAFNNLTKNFKIARNDANSRFDFSFDGTVFGYYPYSVFTGGAYDTTVYQIFGEVAAYVGTATTVESCTDMGSGSIAGTSPSSLVQNVTLTGTVNAVSFSDITQMPQDATRYDATHPTASTMRIGGPGASSVPEITGAGTKGSCAPAAEGTPAASSFQFWQENCPDNAATTGCSNAINFTWSSMTVGTCVTTWATKGTRPINAVWNNAGSSGKTIVVYDGGADHTGCDGTSQSMGNAVKAKFGAGLNNYGIVAMKRTA